MENAFIGLDIGQTKIAAGLVLGSGDVVKRIVKSTDMGHGFEGVHHQCTALISELKEGRDYSVKGIGVGIFGVVDAARGIVLRNHIMRDKPNLSLANILSEEYGVPVKIDNDICAEASGEHRFGAGKGMRVSASIIIGTGAGLGVIINNRIWHGAHSLAGQVGWVGLPCTDTPWRQMFSGEGIETRYAEKAGKKISAKEVFDLANSGNGIAQRIINDATEHAAALIALVQHIIDPEVVILGGNVVLNQDDFVSSIRKKVLEIHDLRRLNLDLDIKIEKAKLGINTGVVGAASLVME
jgi:glucokinase